MTKASREWRTVRLGEKLTIEEIEKSIERGIKLESGYWYQRFHLFAFRRLAAS